MERVPENRLKHPFRHNQNRLAKYWNFQIHGRWKLFAEAIRLELILSRADEHKLSDLKCLTNCKTTGDQMRFKQRYLQALIESVSGVPQPRSRCHILRRYVLSLAFSLYAFYLRRLQDINIILRETRSFFLRIEVQRTVLKYIPVTRSCSNCTPTQLRLLNSYNHARSADISRMAANHPWATAVDFALFLEGWDRGEKWASRESNLDSYTVRSAANSLEACADYTAERPQLGLI